MDDFNLAARGFSDDGLYALEFDEVTTGTTLKSLLHLNAHYTDDDELYARDLIKGHYQGMFRSEFLACL